MTEAGLRDPFDQLREAPLVYLITDSTGSKIIDAFFSDSNGRTLAWRPHVAYRPYKDDMCPVGMMSPANNLYHEAIHATGYDSNIEESSVPGSGGLFFKNAEEQRATNAANAFSRATGEPERSYYYGGQFV